MAQSKLSQLHDWLDERTGYRAALRRAADAPLPGGPRFSYVWGSALALALLLEAITGVLLMAAYAPSATTAWSSVAHITHGLRGGWLIRGLHNVGAQAIVILLVVHLTRVALAGAYRKPRELNWLLGLGLAGLVGGFLFTGPLLVYDQYGYWANKVETNIIGTVPLVGGWLRAMLLGGGEYGHLTLTRSYSLHAAVLPALTVLFLLAHASLARRHGPTLPDAAAGAARADRYFPRQAARDVAVGLVLILVIFGVTAQLHGAPLDAPADPVSDYAARPAWYFRPLFELRKLLPAKLETLGVVGLPALFAAYVAALPFLDKRPERKLAARLPVLAPLLLVLLGGAGLIAKSYASDRADAEYQRARKLADERAARAIALFKEGVPPEGALAPSR